MEVKKIIVAKNDENRLCFAEDGEILIAASPELKSKIILRKSDHFFVGIKSGKQSLYGVIDEAPSGLTTGIIIQDINSFETGNKIASDIEKLIDQVEFTINAINRISIGSPVVTDLKEKSFMDKKLIQKIHKVFF